MSLVVKDRVKESSTVTGTGSVTLLGAASGFQSFNDAIGNANTTYYAIVGQQNGEWEVGVGTYSSAGSILTRDSVLSSSNAGALVSFSAGTKDVFVTGPAAKTVMRDLNGAIPASTIVNTGTLTLPTSTDTLLGRATTDTLTNKTISGATNTLSNIANSSLVNSAVTIGTTSVSLGATTTTLAGLTGVSSSGFTNTSLTAGRVIYTTTGGLETVSANLLFDGTTLTPNALTVTNTVTLSGGTANGVAYLNGSKVLTTGSALTFDGTNFVVNTGSVISGNSTFAGSLNAVGGGSGAVISITPNTISGANGVTYNTSFVAGGSGPHIFSIGGSEQMRLTSTGLGIGTSSPTSGTKLTLQESASNPTALEMINRNSTQRWAIAVDAAAVDDKILAFIDRTNSAVRMALDASGRLSINTTATVAGCNLNVAGGINSTNGALNVSGNGGFYNGANKFGVDNNAGASRFYSSGPNSSTRGSFEFHITDSVGSLDTTAMTLDASGNLLVGQTSGSGRISVTQSGSNDVIKTAIGTSGAAYTVSGSGTTMTSLYMVTSSGLAGQITNSGTTTIYSVASDHRLKTVLGNVSGSGDRIDALQPIEYEWKSDGSHTRGFLAHKFQEVYPNSVVGEKDAVDAEGKPVYQTMQAGSSEVIADLVAEIQSLRARVASLESN